MVIAEDALTVLDRLLQQAHGLRPLPPQRSAVFSSAADQPKLPGLGVRNSVAHPCGYSIPMAASLSASDHFSDRES
jgi:hypothetical protein